MSESVLSSSNDSLELSLTENTNTTLESYSFLFDQAEHNFSTSSEISFNKQKSSSVDHNQTITKEISTTMNNMPIKELIDFNPFLLLFMDDDEQEPNLIETNLPTSSKTSPIHLTDLHNHKVTQCVSRGQGSLNMKTIIRYQQHQPRRESLSHRQTNNNSSDDDQAFEQFLQEHRTANPVKCEEKSSIQQEKKTRNSIKDFICDSSSEEDEPSEFYPNVNRLIDQDLSWRKNKDDDDDTSDECSQSSSSSSSSSESDNRSTKQKKRSVNFLESLSNYVPLVDKHSDAKRYFTPTGFKHKNKRQELANKLFSIFDQDVFSSKLSSIVTVVWSGRLTATAGHCTTRRVDKTATITLSHKVCDSPERCRDTLLHEMCHAAVSLIDGVMNEGHGPLWRKWTRKAERDYPYLPAISVKHTYDIAHKFVYRCVQCHYEVHRHSKSLNPEIDFCGKCMGKFELLLNSTNKTNDVQTPKKTLTRYNLFVKEHFQTMKQAQPHLSTPQLMKHLSQEYKKTTQPQLNPLDLPDLEQLKI